MNGNELNKIVFDVETKKTFDEVGGVDKRDQLGVSYVGIYSYEQHDFFGFFEEELANLEKILLIKKPTLIGFNSKHFDVPVLQPYFKKIDLTALPHLDIMADIEKTLGHRVKLENIAQATLYEGKSGSGLDAIRWYREGDLASLAKYCINDVRVTRDIYDYGQRHGRIYYPTGGEKKPIKITWADPVTITQKIESAFKKHEQIEIEYFEVDDNSGKIITPRKIEILSINGDRFEAFCHRINAKRKFNIADVWQIKETGNTYAHQEKLF